MRDKLQMAAIGPRRNQAVHHAIAAVVKAHALHPAADMPRAREIAARFDAAAKDETTANVVIALGLLLLRSTGFLDSFDESRFPTH